MHFLSAFFEYSPVRQAVLENAQELDIGRSLKILKACPT